MLQEIWAKVTMRERLVVIGAAVAVIAWLLGVLITDSWYSAVGAQTLGLLAVAAAIVAVVVVYLKYAPNTNVTLPAPYAMILLVLAAIVAVVALIGLVQAFTYDPCQGLCNSILGSKFAPSKPITLYIVALGVLAGGAVMAWGAYQEWVASKTAA